MGNVQRKLLILFIGVTGLLPLGHQASGSPVRIAGPTGLCCEYRRNPLGTDVLNPRLSWVMESRDRGARQTAYRVLVASTPELLAMDQGDLWDSGVIQSDQSIQVEYAGKPLKSGMRCHWKVLVRDQDDHRSSWSEPSLWTMGLLEPLDWQAKWIKREAPEPGNAPAPWFRKEFFLTDAPDRAIVYVNVMGYYELYVNGQKVGEDVLSPAVSDLTRRTFYRTYDIGTFLRPGMNCIGVWAGPGWSRSGPVIRIQADLLVKGEPMRIGSDAGWTCAPSNCLPLGNWQWDGMGGERFDARLDIPGWSQPGCTAGEWKPASEVADPAVVVQAQSCPPNRITKIIPLKGLRALGPNTWELDFGTNLTGWMRFRMPKMKPGDRVVFHYADKRFQTPEGDATPAGNIRATSQKIFNTPQGSVSYQTFNQSDEFISAGKPEEQFCPKFNYHGFRYVIVEGLEAQPAMTSAEALLIESDLETVGSFECSNDLFNRIHETNLWTLRCLDLGGYMVDCPHRERLGYGDGQVGIESMVMNRDAAALYGKWAIDWLDTQDPLTGEIGHTAPKSGGGGGPGWGGAGCVLPWKLYLYYGDLRLLEQAYEPARRYVDFLESKCSSGVLRSYGGEWDFIGDWVAPGRGMDTNNWPAKPAAELFNNCYRLYLWEQLAKAAEALGRTDEASRCRTRISEIRPLIHQAFFDDQQNIYVTDEQSYQLMPLMTGVVPADLRETVMKKLEDCILLKNRGHLDTGMLGTYFLIQYLMETGRNDLLYNVFSQVTYPGWGYMLEQGATTLWEQWNGYWSQIHSCFTSPGGWFYQGLAGIRADATAPGFKKIIIKPAIVGDLTWVKCSYHSAHGLIVSNWSRQSGQLSMEVTIPANTTATVFIPTGNARTITESGIDAGKSRSVKFLRTEGGNAVFSVGSGIYRFRSTLPEAGNNK
jgi:alpha-L-rhamnosidase